MSSVWENSPVLKDAIGHHPLGLDPQILEAHGVLGVEGRFLAATTDAAVAARSAVPGRCGELLAHEKRTQVFLHDG